MKKIISTVMSFALIASLAAGCGSNENAGNTNGQTPSSAAASTSANQKVNEYGWAVPEKTLEITAYQADKSNPDTVAKNTELINQYLLEKFNVKINKTQLDIDPNEKLNLMLASNDYLDVIIAMNDDNLSKWKSQGKIQELTPYVDEVGSDIKTALGDTYKRYLDENGKLYGIPRGWGLLPLPDRSAHIRWDWYNEMGSPKIETPDDYYTVLKKMLEQHSRNSKGEKAYAISWNENCNIETIAAIWGLKDGYKEAADHNLTHWLNTPEGLEFTKYFNRFYREGMLDPDAFINKFDDWKTKFSNERIMGHIGNWWESWNAGHEVWQKSDPNWKEDQRYVQIKIKAPQAENAYLAPKDTFGWNYTVITDKCKDAVEIMKFINFTMTPIGTRLVSWGVPNTADSNWKYDGDGKWSFDETAKQSLLSGNYDYTKHDLLGGSQFWFGVQQSPLPDDNTSVCWYDQNFNQDSKWKKMFNDNLKGTIWDSTARRITFTPENPLTPVKQQIEDSIKTGWAKAVLSKTEEDCTANFNELRDKMNKAGLHDIEKFRTEEYKKNLEAWK